MPTLQEVVVGVEHKLCVKHLYGNFRKKYPGQEVKNALWRAARASTEPEFKKAMEILKGLNEVAHNEMNALPHKMWSRYSYCPDKCVTYKSTTCVKLSTDQF